MTDQQRQAWFKYHAPTQDTAPKYKAIYAAEEDLRSRVVMALLSKMTDQEAYDAINSVHEEFADLIAKLAPNCADRTAAIRSVRIAKGLYNEAVKKRYVGSPYSGISPLLAFGTLVEAGNVRIIEARIQANAAIACDGI